MSNLFYDKKKNKNQKKKNHTPRRLREQSTCSGGLHVAPEMSSWVKKMGPFRGGKD